MSGASGEARLRRELHAARQRAALWREAYERLSERRVVRGATAAVDRLAGLAGLSVARPRPPGPPGETPAAYRRRLGAALEGRTRLRIALGPEVAELEGDWPGHVRVSDRDEAVRAADVWITRDPPGLSSPAAPVRVGVDPTGDRDRESGGWGDLDVVVAEPSDPGETPSAVLGAVAGWAEATRFTLSVGVPGVDGAEQWGDLHLARLVRAELRRRGFPTRIQLLDEWYGRGSSRDDVRVHVLGLSGLAVHPEQVNVLWHISHPERLSPGQAEQYHLVAVASSLEAGRLRQRVHAPVVPLLQFTDPDRFRPTPGGPDHDLLFVGNTRGVMRDIVRDLLPTDHDLAVYGEGWDDTDLPPCAWRGRHVPNERLAAHYSATKIVLADHWPTMRERGFVANRVYDALACGAAVVCDDVAGIDALLDGGLVTYRGPSELREHVDRLLDDEAERARLGERGRGIVRGHHTVAQRIDDLLAALRERDLLAPAGGQ